jgi:glucose-1-phosphatase
MTQAIIFDIGNVLLFFDAVQMLRQVCEVCGLEESQAFDLYVHQELGIRYEKGQITSEEFYRRFQLISRKEHTQEAFWMAFSDIFILNREMEAVVYGLKKRGKKLLALSNTCEAHANFFQQKFELFTAFDQRILSYEVGARKPELKIFEAVLQAAGCPPEACLYTDDMADYVLVAQNLGIPSVTFTGTEAFKRHLQRLGLMFG